MRLTKYIRNQIHYAVMKDLPSIDYVKMAGDLIQTTLIDLMPAKVKTLYEEDQTYFRGCNRVFVDSLHIYRSDNDGLTTSIFFGVPHIPTNLYDLNLTNNPEKVHPKRKEAIESKLSEALISSGYITKHFEQQQLKKNVSSRLKASLESVTTTQKLKDVLEPELHRFIPQDPIQVKTLLPSTIAPVVSDLKLLGAKL